MHHAIDPKAIVEILRRDGIAVVEDFVSGDALQQLQKEFEGLFAGEHRGISSMRHPTGPALRIRRGEMEDASFPTVASVFGAEQLRRVVDEYLPADSTFNDDIVATHDVLQLPIAETHFDMRRALKFYVYLLDTEDTNGAFFYAPRTHVTNARDRERFLARGGRLKELGNIPGQNESIPPPKSMPARAGTLLIFDTEGWHGATEVRAGRERRILRAASRFGGQPARKARWLSRQWFRESSRNWRRRPASEVFPAGRRSSGGTSRAKT
jgi:ectoine hydroxylase-related dioxygenase (phytanoyl-CoA dioxygenase family)